MINLAVYDKGGGRFSKNATPAAKSVFGDDKVTSFDPLVTPQVAPLVTFSHILCHLYSAAKEHPSWPDLVTSDLRGVKVIIRVSSEGPAGMSDSFRAPYRLSENGPWILHLLERSADVSTERWVEVFRVLKEWDNTNYARLLREVAVIFDRHPETQFALRILCEAWTYCAEKGADGGIGLRAPATSEEWFGPFGKPSPMPVDAEELAQLLGDAYPEAKVLLEAVLVTKEIRLPVRALLAKLRNYNQSGRFR